MIDVRTILEAEWVEVPTRSPGVFWTEEMVWVQPGKDEYQRTLALWKDEKGTRFVIVSDRNDQPTQTWMVKERRK